jgi:integrase
LSGSKVRNVIVAVQALYRRFRRQVTVDPTHDLDLPEVAGRREWSGTPVDAEATLEPLPDDVQAIYATAFYGGLRRGELRALRVRNLHGLDGAGEPFIDVEHGWDDYKGEIDPKSTAAARRALLPESPQAILADHVAATGRAADDLVFGRTPSEPFTPTFVSDGADDAWAAAAIGAFLRGESLPVELRRVTLHECRHAHGSFLDAAGISESRCDRYMGHARAGVADRYRHQLRGQLADDAGRLDEYLAGRGAGNLVHLATGAHSGGQAAKTALLSQAV